MPIYASDHLINGCHMRWDLPRIRRRTSLREPLWTVKASRHKWQGDPPRVLHCPPWSMRCRVNSGQPRLFLIQSAQPDQSVRVPGMETSVVFGVGLCCRKPKTILCIQVVFLLPLGFSCVSAHSCGGQNQHLFRNGMAVDRNWWGKETRPDRCQRDKWCWCTQTSRSTETGQSYLCFSHSWLPSRFEALGNDGVAICLAD